MQTQSRARPSDFPPPFDAEEFIAEPSDPEEERIDVGALVVGAGPAGLAAAIRLAQLLEESPETSERLGEVPIAVVEKGKAAGSWVSARATAAGGRTGRSWPTSSPAPTSGRGSRSWRRGRRGT